jgi:hypothetical protein
MLEVSLCPRSYGEVIYANSKHVKTVLYLVHHGTSSDHAARTDPTPQELRIAARS